MENENIKVVDALEAIRKKNGGILKPEVIVKEAENVNHPLHDEFIWDDSKAAHEYRLEQARKLIRVIVKVLPSTEFVTRAYVSLQQDRRQPGGGYRTIEAVMRNPKLRAALLKEALAEMNAFEEKYRQLKELAPIFEAIKRVKKGKK